MNLSCEIIRDLLPLYHDGVCSNDSKALVEEHLMYCANCRTELIAMDHTFPMNMMEQNLKEAAAVKRLSKAWKAEQLKSLLKGALLTLSTVIVFVLILYLFIGIEIG